MHQIADWHCDLTKLSLEALTVYKVYCEIVESNNLYNTLTYTLSSPTYHILIAIMSFACENNVIILYIKFFECCALHSRE